MKTSVRLLHYELYYVFMGTVVGLTVSSVIPNPEFSFSEVNYNR